MSSSSNDYSKYGIEDAPKSTVTTAFGKTKTFARLYHIEWAFLAVSFVNILTAIGLTLYRLVVVVRDNPESSDFTFIILLLINSAFSVFYVIHGVLRERVYELYTLMAAILVVALYCILEFFAFASEKTTVKLVRVIMVIVMAPPNIILAYFVSRGFGYLEFRIVGASEFLQRLYREAAIFSCLLKFDLQAACSVVVLALKDGTNMSTIETVSLLVGIPFSLFWSVFGWVTLRKEMKKCAIVFALLGLSKPSYYMYKIISEYISFHEQSQDTDDTIIYSLISAVTVGLLVWLMLMVDLVFVFRNFGKGLRQRVESFHAETAVKGIDEKTSLLGSSPERSKPIV